MTDPVEWLTKKLAKVEKQARGQWTAKNDIRCPNCTPNYVTGWKSRSAARDRTVFTLEPCGCQVSRGVVMERAPDEEKLRLVAATRTGVLELHTPIVAVSDFPQPETREQRCSRCCDIDAPGHEWEPLPWPCPTLRAVAAGWGWTGE